MMHATSRLVSGSGIRVATHAMERDATSRHLHAGEQRRLQLVVDFHVHRETGDGFDFMKELLTDCSQGH